MIGTQTEGTRTATIRAADPHEPGATALLRQSHALMRSLYPAEANSFLSIDALKAPEIRFFVAEAGGVPCGCGALAIREGYGEVKSIFVAPEARGSGSGALLLDAIEAAARGAGLSRLMLETGTGLDAAHRLYQRAGFGFCGAFGDYALNPYSLFMAKPLA
ncbi:MAG: GNAT family N-acetyltransferase [Paracoccaceae bacterium]